MSVCRWPAEVLVLYGSVDVVSAPVYFGPGPGLLLFPHFPRLCTCSFLAVLWNLADENWSQFTMRHLAAEISQNLCRFHTYKCQQGIVPIHIALKPNVRYGADLTEC